jgi:hypothetical protein
VPNEPSNPVVGRLVAAISDGIWTRPRRRSPRPRRDADNHRLPVTERLRKNGWTLAERAGEVSPDGMRWLPCLYSHDVDRTRRPPDPW